MKKIIALMLILTLSVFAFAACGGDDDEDTTNTDNTTTDDTTNDDTTNDDNAPEAKTYTLSIAVDDGFKTVSNKGASTVIALALLTDSEGKIVAARFDSVEASLKVTDDEIKTVSRIATKVEQGAAYDASRPMPAGTWYVQAQAFENGIIGKTPAEVAALEGFVAGCTMATSTPVFKALVAEADAYTRKVTFTTSETVTLGLAIDAKLSGSVEDGATFGADFAAVAIAGGKVVASMLDSAEATYAFEYNTEDEKYDITATFKGTKNEQGDAYDAWQPMPSGRWYAQAQAFANTAVGKTVAELNDLATSNVAGCSIYAGGYKAVIVRAAGYAR